MYYFLVNAILIVLSIVTKSTTKLKKFLEFWVLEASSSENLCHSCCVYTSSPFYQWIVMIVILFLLQTFWDSRRLLEIGSVNNNNNKKYYLFLVYELICNNWYDCYYFALLLLQLHNVTTLAIIMVSGCF